MGQNRIEYGKRIFQHTDILSGNCVLGNDLIGEALSIDTLEFDVRSEDTILTTFTRNAPLKYYFDSQLVGQFYVTRVEQVGKYRYRFTATSVIGLLDESRHYGGVYSGETSGDIIASILNGVAYTIADKLTGVKMYGWLPVDSRRNNLCQVLFALGASVRKNDDGSLNITLLSNDVTSTITEDRIFDGGSVTHITPATRVDVTEHQYIPNEESITLYAGTVETGEIIIFKEPMHSLSAYGATILESGANYAKLSAGTVTLTGKKYTHTTKLVSVASVTEERAENVFSVEDATLVSLPNSLNVAERVLKYYETVEEISSEIVLADERPGDMVAAVHPFGGSATGGLKDLDITLGSFLRANATVRVGFEASSPSGNLYENMEIISESGVWTVPDGVSKIRVVLIGGGRNGSSGGSGTPGGDAGSMYAGNAGTGGRGGIGGTGGKVLELTKSVKGGDSFDVLIAQPGGDTEFGSESSANGELMKDGYTEVTTGITYALPGQQGRSGSDGIAGTATGTAVKGVFYPPNGGTYKTMENIGYVGSANGGSNAWITARYYTDKSLKIEGQAVTGAKGIDGYNGSGGSTYGSGGHGGGGGSGGNGAGGYTISVGTGTILHFNSSGYADEIPVSGVSFGTAKGGKGGSGGSGGAGAPGCIIIYY